MGRTASYPSGEVEEKLQWKGKDACTMKKRRMPSCGKQPRESRDGRECQLKRSSIPRAKKWVPI